MMKRLLLATALSVSAMTATAAINSSYWTVNNNGLPVVQEDSGGLQFVVFETCNAGLHGITFYDAKMEYKGEGYTIAEMKLRVDKKTIHTFSDVDVLESEVKGAKYLLLVDDKVLSEMRAGNTMRIQYNGEHVETYSLIGFTRAVNDAPRPAWCDEPSDDDYFQDSKGNEYFRS